MNINSLKNIIDIAMKRKKASLVLKNCKIIDVFSHEIMQGDIAIENGKIAGIGEYSGVEEIDINNKYVSPGFIDGHIHIESSMVSPKEFAKAVVPRGTTSIVADPHEIANVAGIDGIKYMLNETEELPLNTFIMLPSCVPATPFENSGAVLKADDLEELMGEERVLGLGEMMNYVGVIGNQEDVIEKLALANKYNKIVDGHGPEISGEKLNAYCAGCVKTEHECSTIDEMLERIRMGMYILIRQGSAAKNLEALAAGLTKENMRRCLLCTDDRHPQDLINEGHIDNNIRIALKCGVDPISAIKMATLNAAECYNLKHLGAVAPSYNADLVVFDNFEDFNILKVFKDGILAAENNTPLFKREKSNSNEILNSVNIKDITISDLKIKIPSKKANVISLLPHNLVTKLEVRDVTTEEDGFFIKDKNKDIVKIAVIERHNATGNIGLALVENFGIQNGAIASTVAHDSHNIVVIGDNDQDILAAVEEIKNKKGGITIVSESKVIKTLPLPIAGLMSDKSLEEVQGILGDMLKISYEKLKVSRTAEPFMTLAFLALPVIPEVKVTDKGLFDVRKFEFIDIEAIMN